MYIYVYILGQPFVQDPRVFVEECRALFTRQWDDFEDGNGRAGDNITEFFATIRRHRVIFVVSLRACALNARLRL